MSSVKSRVVQVTNVSPSASSDQLRTLFGHVGVLEEVTVFPSDEKEETSSKVCYIRYQEAINAEVALHLNNTVFLDRALIVLPLSYDLEDIPDEKYASLVKAPPNTAAGILPRTADWPLDVISMVVGRPGEQVIQTIDPKLSSMAFPSYPPLPATTDGTRIEEVRRTILVTNLDPKTTGDQVLDFFNKHAEVRCVRMAGTDVDRAAYVEFTQQPSIIKAFGLMGATLNGRQPANNIALIDETKRPIVSESAKLNSRTRSKSRSREKRSRSPRRSTSKKRRSRSRDKKRSRSRGKRRSKSRSRSRDRYRYSRSRSRDRHRNDRGRSKSYERRKYRRSTSRSDRRYSRSRSRGHRSDRRERDRYDRYRDRDRDRDRERERDRDRDRDRERDRDKDREKDRDRIKDKDRDRGRDRDRERAREKDRPRDSEHRDRDREKNRHRDRDRDKNHVESKSSRHGHSDTKDSKRRSRRAVEQTDNDNADQNSRHSSPAVENPQPGQNNNSNNNSNNTSEDESQVGSVTDNNVMENGNSDSKMDDDTESVNHKKPTVLGVKLAGPEDLDYSSPANSVQKLSCIANGSQNNSDLSDEEMDTEA